MRSKENVWNIKLATKELEKVTGYDANVISCKGGQHIKCAQF